MDEPGARGLLSAETVLDGGAVHLTAAASGPPRQAMVSDCYRFYAGVRGQAIGVPLAGWWVVAARSLLYCAT